jgi:tetratricopeptide (TPR) repeat protein
MKTFLAAFVTLMALTVCVRGAEPPAPADAAADETAAQPAAGNDGTPAERIAHWREVLDGAVAKHDLNGVLTAIDEIIKLDPQNYQNYLAKVSMLRLKGDRAGILATRRKAAEALAGSATGLNELAWDLVTDEKLELRDPELALKCAEESVRLSKRKDAAALDTLARAWYELGIVEKAVELQKESLVAASNADERTQIKEALEYYEAVLKVRAEALK